jgi:hypothetical protein
VAKARWESKVTSVAAVPLDETDPPKETVHPVAAMPSGKTVPSEETVRLEEFRAFGGCNAFREGSPF